MTTFPTAPRADPRPEAPLVGAALQPIVAGFFPDPSVCRVGDTYYLVNSSFEYAPGVPIHRSRDLVQWEQIGNVLSGPEHFPAGSAGASGGVYAPTLRHHDGRFWMITTNVSGERPGQLLTSATDPAGPWEPARVVEGLRGIDPDLAWDEDGTCYLTYCSSDPELPGIAQARVDLETATLVSPPQVVWSGTGMAHPEGPHLYRRGGFWYLLIAEGGTERGHGVSIGRSRSPQGPFETAPSTPVFTHRSTRHPVQNTGHADLIELADGGWAAVYLGARPRGTTPSFHVNGRETFLAGIDWVDGWPRFVEERFSLEAPGHSFVDDFASPVLDPRWISPGAFPASFASAGDGLVLNRAPAPSLLATRTRDEEWTFDVTVRDGDVGVLVRIDDRHELELRLVGGRAEALLRVGAISGSLGAVDVVEEAVVLRLRSRPSATGGPDDLEAGLVGAGGSRPLGRVDGRYLSTEVAGGFTGRVVGLRALSDTARVSRVAYAGTASASTAGAY